MDQNLTPQDLASQDLSSGDLSSGDISPQFDERGLIPAVVQDADSGQVLMLAYMNAESYRLTLQTGETYFWSRSRQSLWHKGATSGNIQKVVEMALDCDQDTLLVKVKPAGPACHTGEQTCFHNPVEVG